MISSSGRHLEFGKGDIGIHMGDTSNVALLVFRNLEHPLPVGHMVGGNEKKDIELRKSDVVMSFTVDRVTRIIAVYCGVPGGTKNTIDHAIKCGVEVENV